MWTPKRPHIAGYAGGGLAVPQGGDGQMGWPLQSTIAQGPPPNINPYKLGGRIPARWTYPYAGYGQPLLELPQNRFMRISLCVNAWLGEPIINSASKLTIFLAFEKMILTVQSNCKKIPDWIPKNEQQKYIDQYGSDKPGQIAAAYVKQKCLELIEYLNVKTFIEDIALDVLVNGDGFINIASNATPDEEQEVWQCQSKEETVNAVKELKAKMAQDGRGSYDIFALQGLNPSAVWLYPDYAGRITHAKVVHLMGEGVWDINLNNLIHLKPFSFAWVIYGVPHYISALKWVDIKFKLMDALYVNAKRYVTPREWLKIKGPETPEGGALPPTDEQMAWAEQILSYYATDTPFVLPDGWEWQYLGAEGKVLKVEGLIEKVDDALRTAAQVSRTFTSGAANVPAYATSKLQAGVMYKALQPLRSLASRAVEGRILQRYCLFNGFFEEDGTLIAPKVEFQSMPIQGDDSIEKKIAALGQLGFISPITAWEIEGMDPTVEMDRITMSQQLMTEPWRAIAPDIGPSQTPDRHNENLNQNQKDLTKAKMLGYRKLDNHLSDMLDSLEAGNSNLSERCELEVRKYLTQASFLMHADAKNRLDQAIDWADQIADTNEAMQDPDTLDKAGYVSSETKLKRPENGHSITI
jgi:hypothetical protein